MIQTDEMLLTEAQVSRILGIKQRTLQQWRLTERGPKFLKLSARVVRYRLSDVQNWISEAQL